MKKSLALIAFAPLLLGAKYVEPSENYATVEFTQSGNPQATFHRNGKDCSGMETLPGQPFYFTASAGPLKVPAGQPVAFKLFQFKGMMALGNGLNEIRGCHVATSFTPAAGATYRVDLNGVDCRVDVFGKSTDGTESPAADARVRIVKPPFFPSGPFCKADG